MGVDQDRRENLAKVFYVPLGTMRITGLAELCFRSIVKLSIASASVKRAKTHYQLHSIRCFTWSSAELKLSPTKIFFEISKDFFCCLVLVTCKDFHFNCADWARRGECTRNPRYMLKNCKKSCKRCHGGGGGK